MIRSIKKNALKKASLFFILFALLVCGCGNQNEVVIYTSVDQPFAEPVLQEFSQKTGIKVRPVFDTEAAKTVGLVNRIRAEDKAVKADIFWSSEFAHSMQLAQEGYFASYVPASATDIPAKFRCPDNLWTAFGLRARVFLVHKEKLAPASYPSSINDLLDPAWEPEQITVAVPLFGTTNTHAAAIWTIDGQKAMMDFFETLKENKAAYVDGNASTRDRVVNGSSLVGLTDTDDALVAIKKGAPVKMVFPDQGENQPGTLVIPNTVSMLKNCPNPENAKKFIDFITSAKGEKILIDKSEGFFSVRKNNETQPDWIPASGIKSLEISFEEVSRAVGSASKVLKEYFL
ncbi:MAG: extracellular solute-binding protein [Candidatus Rifleibacteriota bacterium]